MNSLYVKYFRIKVFGLAVTAAPSSISVRKYSKCCCELEARLREFQDKYSGTVKNRVIARHCK